MAMTHSSIKALIVRGPSGAFYAIPIEDLKRYEHKLNNRKQKNLDSLVGQSKTNGRAVDAFYHDQVATADSEGIG